MILFALGPRTRPALSFSEEIATLIHGVQNGIFPENVFFFSLFDCSLRFASRNTKIKNEIVWAFLLKYFLEESY